MEATTVIIMVVMMVSRALEVQQLMLLLLTLRQGHTRAGISQRLPAQANAEDKGEEPAEHSSSLADDPPQEVFDAGHDRCIVPLRPENVMTWLTPEGRSLDDLDQLLEDWERPYYEHQLLAA